MGGESQRHREPLSYNLPVQARLEDWRSLRLDQDSLSQIKFKQDACVVMAIAM